MIDPILEGWLRIAALCAFYALSAAGFLLVRRWWRAKR